MNRFYKSLWIGSEHEAEEAFASPWVNVKEIYSPRRSESFLQALCKKKSPPPKIQIVDDRRIEQLSNQKGNSFWILVEVGMIQSVKECMEEFAHPSLVLILDQIQDPQNLGTLIRTAHFFNCDFVMMPKDHSAPITEVVSRASAGAVFSIPLVRVTNLVREINVLKEMPMYIVSLSPESKEPLHLRDLAKDAVGIIIGNEGAGVRRLVDETADFRCSLTEFRHRDSLNAAIAGGVALYEIRRQKS